MSQPSASVILTTYNQPRALELVLWGYAAQTRRDFQLVIADDGSGEETREVVERLRSVGLDLLHVWHDDRGFRKCEILNRAILAAHGDYLIFSDADCIPRSDFVDTHLLLAERGYFLSGGYLKLPDPVSARITGEDVRSGRVADPGWLRRQGWRPGRHALRLLKPGATPTLLDALTPTRASWNGHNASTWKSAVVEANGFDMEMAYGGLDRAFGELLQNAGVSGKQIRHRAPCLHLHHRRPYFDAEKLRKNRALRARIRSEGIIRARRGLTELDSAI